MPKIHQSDSYFPIKDCKKNRCKLFGYHNRMYDKRISYLCKMFKTIHHFIARGGGDLDFVVTNPKLRGGASRKCNTCLK